MKQGSLLRRTLIPFVLLTLGALACSLAGGPPTSAPNALATGAAATLTALAPQFASGTPVPTQAPAGSETPVARPSATTASATTAATGAPTAAPPTAAATTAPGA